jgi:phosphoserine phosphatase
MDSTLIQTEVIDELAELAGVGDQVRYHRPPWTENLILAKALNNAALLEGLSEEVHKVATNLPITKGSTAWCALKLWL